MNVDDTEKLFLIFNTGLNIMMMAIEKRLFGNKRMKKAKERDKDRQSGIYDINRAQKSKEKSVE